MAFYNLKCGAEFERCDVALMEQHVKTCLSCQWNGEIGHLKVGSMRRAVSVSVVDVPVDPNCQTSDGRFLAIDWERVSLPASMEEQISPRTGNQSTPLDTPTS